MCKSVNYAAAVCIFLLASFNHAGAATTEEWRRDVQAIVHDILAIHPGAFKKVGEKIWRRQANTLLQELPRLSEPERIVRLMQLVARIGDGHTRIELESSDYASWYPIRIYEFSDGYFVTSAHKSVRHLAGAKVISIAGRPAKDVVEAARSLMGADNQFDRKERLYAVHNSFLMRGLGYARRDGSLEFGFRRRSGGTVKETLRPRRTDENFYSKDTPIFQWHYPSEVYGLPIDKGEDWISAYKNLPSSAFRERDDTRPPFLQERTRYTRRALPQQDAYYVQFNQTDDSGMVGYMGEAFKEIDKQKPKRLIIDIRNNFGGDGSTVTPMLHQFIARKRNKPWDELYLITGPKTFSAAMAIIDAFVEHTEVTLVGEPAGAGPIFYGDTINRPYPALGLDLEVSALRYQLTNSNDTRAFVPVDVPAPLSFAGYARGRDTAVDPILSGAEMRSIPVIALMDGGAAARRVYQERKKRFARLSWHRPPEEFSLRRVMDKLIAQERYEDALETAKLNSEIHPYIWNTWYNLARAQTVAGPPHSEGRFGSYKCVVLLAPTNWNVPRIKQFFKRKGVDPEPPPGCPVDE